jgi:mono/diheme cytochrome c family protein
MMKKFGIIIGIVSLVVATGCSKVRRNPGRVYMPDMAYSRAYETYASTENLKAKGINYNAMPVPGSIARGDQFPYTLGNDSAGYEGSKSVKNPLPALDAKKYLEAARLYQIHCAICHGAALDGNGPLYNNGNGPYQAAPRNFMGDPLMKSMHDGQYFHSVTYGKGMMGSYASQLSTEQRWMVIHYIREKQGMAGGTSAGADTTAAPVTTPPTQTAADTTKR